MHDRFRLLVLKLPLQKGSEAKVMLLVPTDAANTPIIGTVSSEDSAYLPQQALSPQSGTGRNRAGQTAPHLGYWN